MKKISNKIKRKLRNRKKLKKVNVNRYRVTVSKSLNNLSAQIIDDKEKKTLVSASSVEKEIKAKKIKTHEVLMKVAIALSLIFLIMYVAYHMTSEPTPFGGDGYIKYFYYFILITHIFLSILFQF